MGSGQGSKINRKKSSEKTSLKSHVNDFTFSVIDVWLSYHSLTVPVIGVHFNIGKFYVNWFLRKKTSCEYSREICETHCGNWLYCRSLNTPVLCLLARWIWTAYRTLNSTTLGIRYKYFTSFIIEYIWRSHQHCERCRKANFSTSFKKYWVRNC